MPPLTDRNSERAALDQLVDAVRVGERPLICVIDDEQWLDQASARHPRPAGWVVV